MGMSYEAICNDCGAKFTANEGGGFVFHLLHCDRCGAERAISFRHFLSYQEGSAP